MWFLSPQSPLPCPPFSPSPLREMATDDDREAAAAADVAETKEAAVLLADGAEKKKDTVVLDDVVEKKKKFTAVPGAGAIPAAAHQEITAAASGAPDGGDKVPFLSSDRAFTLCFACSHR